MNFTIHQGDNKDILKTLDNECVDAVVTDPPYGIDFLGKSWDANTGALETYAECFRVLKPGGYILAFSAARTYHHLAVTLEQAGFEIRDQLMWLYSQAMPKGNNLKPAHEPIALGVKGKPSALNINATRVPRETMTYPANGISRLEFNQQKPQRWTGELTVNDQGGYPHNVIGEVEGYQKYFYCPKVSKTERSCFNNHPTVKPVALMRYLIQLVAPDNSVVLDPFTGSGSTGMAAVELGHTFIGCELDPNYVDIATKRITAWNTEPEPQNSFNKMFTKRG